MFQHAGTSKLLGKPKIGSKPPSQTILGNLLPWHTATGITQWVLPPAVCYACNHVQIGCMASLGPWVSSLGREVKPWSCGSNLWPAATCQTLLWYTGSFWHPIWHMTGESLHHWSAPIGCTWWCCSASGPLWCHWLEHWGHCRLCCSKLASGLHHQLAAWRR